MRPHVILAILTWGWGGTSSNAYAADAPRSNPPDKPVLRLRATPSNTLSPARVLLIAELTGGSNHEDYYCPEVEWDFDNGSRSAHESDCEPFSAKSVLERRFTIRQAFLAAGEYRITVRLRRAQRVVAEASTVVRVNGPGGAGSSPFAAQNQ